MGPKPNHATYLHHQISYHRVHLLLHISFCYHLSGPINSCPKSTKLTKLITLNFNDLHHHFASARKRNGGVIDVCGVPLCTSCQYFIRSCSLFLVTEIGVFDGEFCMHKQDDLGFDWKPEITLKVVCLVHIFFII